MDEQTQPEEPPTKRPPGRPCRDGKSPTPTWCDLSIKEENQPILHRYEAVFAQRRALQIIRGVRAKAYAAVQETLQLLGQEPAATGRCRSLDCLWWSRPHVKEYADFLVESVRSVCGELEETEEGRVSFGLKKSERRFCELHVFQPAQAEAYRQAREELGLPETKNGDKHDASLAIERPEVQAYFEKCTRLAKSFFPQGEIPGWMARWGHANSIRRFSSPAELANLAKKYFENLWQAGPEEKTKTKPYGLNSFCVRAGIPRITFENYRKGKYGPEFVEAAQLIRTCCLASWEQWGAENPKGGNFANQMLDRLGDVQKKYEQEKARATVQAMRDGTMGALAGQPVTIVVFGDKREQVQAIDSRVVPALGGEL